MGLFDFFKNKSSNSELQKNANDQLAATDLSQYLKIQTELVGATLKNPDGSDRQLIISKLKPGDAMQIKTYMHKGKETIAIMNASGQIAGHLPAVLTERLFDEHKGAKMVVLVNEITGGEAGMSYGCNIDLYVG